MNMPKSISDSAYAGIVSTLNVPYKDIANASMSIAAEDIRNEHINTISDDTVDIDISADGAWQRRGFASLNGIATIMAVDICKCLDYEVLTKECKACQVWEGKKGSIEYDNFMVYHDCLIIHQGFASLQWSLQEQRFVSNVLYENIIYDTRLLSKVDPYNGTPVVKKECGPRPKAAGHTFENIKKKDGENSFIRPKNNWWHQPFNGQNYE